METATVLRIVSAAVALALLISAPPTALADNVVVGDQSVQGDLCVGTPCINGEVYGAGGEIKIRGASAHIRFDDTDFPTPQLNWRIIADSEGFRVLDSTAAIAPFRIDVGATGSSFRIDSLGRVGIGTAIPSQMLQVNRDHDGNTFHLVTNHFNGLNANAVVRTQADTAIQNFQSHASSRTLVRWGVPLGGWNEFLSVVGNGLAMGTLGNAPFILGTSATTRMTFDGNSNFIDFAGGGQYDGNSFLDASSRTLKQDIRPLGPDAAKGALAGLEPVTFAYTGAPGDPRVGFVAEDVPELVATPGRTTLSALEIVAVLTKVVQEQQNVVRDQQKALQEQRQTLEEQQKALAELTARLATLEARP
jgi:hypothetical protein